MKNLKILLLFICSMALTNGYSNHYAGVNISYDYIGDSTGIAGEYRFTVKVFIDEGTGSLAGVTNFGIGAASSCAAVVGISLTRINPPPHLAAGNGGFIVPGRDFCHSKVGALRVYSMYIFAGNYVLSTPCADWRFYFVAPGRTGGVNNLVGGQVGNDDLYVHTTLNNLHGNNDSPETAYMENAKYFCVGSDARINPNHKEKDGDSLYFKFTPAHYSETIVASYNAGYSATSPITPLNTAILDPVNGLLRFKPTQMERDVIALTIEEWRKDTLGVYYLISESQRDFEIFITNSCDTMAVNWGPYGDTIPLISNLECGDSLISLKLSRSTHCQSIDSDGSDFKILTPNGDSLEISSVLKSCMDSYTDSINLVLSDTLSQNDTLYLISRKGSSQNSLFNSCGFESRVGDTLMFRVQNCLANNFGIDNSLAYSEWTVYPNPSKGLFQVKFKGMEGLKELSVYDVRGQLVLQHSSSNMEVEIDLTFLEPGIYFIQNRSTTNWSTKKLLVE